MHKCALQANKQLFFLATHNNNQTTVATEAKAGQPPKRERCPQTAALVCVSLSLYGCMRLHLQPSQGAEVVHLLHKSSHRFPASQQIFRKVPDELDRPRTHPLVWGGTGGALSEPYETTSSWCDCQKPMRVNTRSRYVCWDPYSKPSTLYSWDQNWQVHHRCPVLLRGQKLLSMWQLQPRPRPHMCLLLAQIELL